MCALCKFSLHVSQQNQYNLFHTVLDNPQAVLSEEVHLPWTEDVIVRKDHSGWPDTNQIPACNMTIKFRIFIPHRSPCILVWKSWYYTMYAISAVPEKRLTSNIQMVKWWLTETNSIIPVQKPVCVTGYIQLFTQMIQYWAKQLQQYVRN